MYKTIEDARNAVNRIKGKYNEVTFVITENKLTKNARKTWYAFRALVNEVFSADWQQYQDHSFYRMIELAA